MLSCLKYFNFNLSDFLSTSTFLFLHLFSDWDAACDAVGGAISSWGVSYGWRRVIVVLLCDVM